VYIFGYSLEIFSVIISWKASPEFNRTRILRKLGFFKIISMQNLEFFLQSKPGSGAAQLGTLNQCTPMEILQYVLEHIIPFAEAGCEFMVGCKKNFDYCRKNFGWLQNNSGDTEKNSNCSQSSLDSFKRTSVVFKTTPQGFKTHNKTVLQSDQVLGGLSADYPHG